MKNSRTWILDGVFLLFIVLVGWFLIGYYLNYNYLATGYQDWIYHAFRIKSIQEWGIVSWDHKWANGINYWKMYQYIPHLITLYTAKTFDIGITNAMNLWIVSMFIYIRVTSYMLLRYLKVSSYLSLGVVLFSYSFRQNWIGISDYSIFFACFLFPILIYLSIRSVKDPEYLLLFGGLSGFAWLLHPILGLFSVTLYMFISYVVTRYKTLWPYLGLSFFLIASMPYWIQFVLLGYNFANPYHTTTAFLKEVSLGDYFRLGIWYVILYFVSLGLSFTVKMKNGLWVKTVGVFILFFLFSFLMVQYEYTPFILNKLQFSRVNLIIGFTIPIFIGVALDPIINITKSRFILGIYVIVLGILVSNAISGAQVFTPVALNTLRNPVDIYLSHIPVEGTVYFSNDSETSYFTDWNIRLSGSYNEHLLPSPLSLRFKQIMSGGKSHLIVSQRQIDLINTYSKVLGVEYLVLPIKSPITKSLLSSETEFVYQDDVTVDNSAYSVFRNENNTDYAYVMERSVFDENVALHDLPKPDLRSVSYDVWDNEIESLAGLLESNDVQVLPMEFVNTDELRVNTEIMRDFDDPILLITQSYDSNWDVVGDTSATIEPTSLRFMKVEPSSFESEITLKNSWPSWHWPVQYLGFGSVIVSAIAVGVYEMTRKENHAV